MFGSGGRIEGPKGVCRFASASGESGTERIRVESNVCCAKSVR
jgi:hypothetical protein